MSPLPPRPIDATLSVTRAARLLGVHPNTVRAWSDAGRLRYYRINPRGDRRYRLGDLQRFLAAAAAGGDGATNGSAGSSGSRGGQHSARHAAVHASSAIATDAEAETTTAGGALGVLAELAGLAPRVVGRDRATLDEVLADAAQGIRDGLGVALAVIWQLDGASISPRAAAGTGAARLMPLPADAGTVGRALRAPTPTPVVDSAPAQPVAGGLGGELAVRITVAGRPWGALLLAGSVGPQAVDVTDAAGRTLSALIELVGGGDLMSRQAHRAEALRRVAADLGSRLDPGQIAPSVVDHAIVLFDADRAALALRSSDDGLTVEASRGLSDGYLAVAADVRPGSIAAAALSDLGPVHAVGYRDDPRAATVRAAVVQEGFDTIAVAPLFVGDETLGFVTLFHDRPRAWREEDLDALAAFASHAAVAIRTARNYAQMATWTAQLQSIQQLGARLNRMTTVDEIGTGIATELRQLIDYHNVRVYRQYGDELIPVAMLGQVGEYVDETPEQLKVQVGQGITGWVAEHKIPQVLDDAAKDPRGHTIPGTDDDLDESMLVAPMLFEDQSLGVLVLSKLGLHQFTEDDLRLLVIYASFAAQAMANADASEQLRRQSEAVERQARSQRHLLQITESILTTLDPRAVLDQIADRLGELVAYDNISIEVYDRALRLLRPLTARGVNADDYLQEWEVGEQGVATWAIEQNEAVLIVDQFDDPRVQHFASTGPVHGGLIVVPLRGREGVAGVLTVERLGVGNTFSNEEFELVELFAAQVSIALHNAEVHNAVEIRARTDGLTGLLNHGTFRERLAAGVARAEPFSLVMMDLDAFKRVNDALGHQAGDRLLTEIAAAIVSAGRDSDQVFRYGGDEFAVLLVGADASAAVVVTERIRAAVHAVGAPGTAWAAEGIGVSGSFGVASFPDDGTTATSVLLAADRACFVAKRAGEGRIATADEGLALAGEFSLQEPTPVDSASATAA